MYEETKRTRKKKEYVTKKLKGYSGITLIALVITVIVLLILAGVTIASLGGQNGILTNATKAKEETRYGNVKEAVDLWKSEENMAKYTGGTVKTLDDILQELGPDGQKYLTEEDVTNIRETGKTTIAGKDIEFVAVGANLVEEFKKGTTIKIGDYVNYNPIATDDSGTENKYKYTSEGTASGMSEYTGSDVTDEEKTQNFKVNTATKWRVLGLNEDETQLVLISEEPISKETTNNNPDYYLYGATGAINCITEFNNISAIYGNGDTAEKAESVTMEDIDKICGVTVDRTNKKLLGKSGTEISNYNSDSMTVYSGDTNDNYKNAYRINDSWTAKEGPANITVTSDYYGYKGNKEGLQTNTTTNATNGQTLYEMIFGTAENQYYYWLASRGVGANSYAAGFGPGYVGSYRAASSGSALFFSDGREQNFFSLVRPKILLKAEVKVDVSTYETGKDANGVWQIK